MSTAFMAFSAACWASKQRSSRYTSGTGVFARVRLLRARLSHSLGSSGAKRSDGIDQLALTKGRGDHQRAAVPISFDVFRRNDDHVDGLADAEEVHIDVASQMSAVKPAPFDHQKVDVAVRPHLTPCRRAEHDDLLGFGYLDDPTDDLV